MYSPGRIFYMVVDVKKQQKLFRNSSITAAPRHLPIPPSRLRRATSRSLRHGCAVPPPFSLREKGGFWAVLLHTVVPLSKRGL